MRGIVIAGTLALCAGSAHGDGAGVIATSDGDRTAVAAAMLDAMAGRAGRLVGDAVAEARAAHAAGVVPVEELQRFRRVREQIDEGWKAYKRVAIEVAAQRLAAARTEAEPLVALPGGAELYAEAALKLGAVLDTMPPRKDEARRVIALALRLDPDQPVTLAEYSPDVKALVDAVRAAAPEPAQPLHVVAQPANALVQIDGAPPVAAGELSVPRGQHLVVARAPGHRATVRGVAADVDRVELALPPDDEGARLAAGATRGMAEAAAQELVDAALRDADLDEVVLVAETMRRGGPTLLVQRCAGRPARCSAVVEIGFSDRRALGPAAKSAWEAARTGELRYPPSALGARDEGGGTKRCGKTCQRIVWAGVGAVVVASVIAIVASGTSPPPVVGVDGRNF